jgi:hypothetical protein
MLVLVTLGAAWGLRRRLAGPDGTADDPPSGSDPPTPVVVHA